MRLNYGLIELKLKTELYHRPLLYLFDNDFCLVLLVCHKYSAMISSSRPAIAILLIIIMRQTNRVDCVCTFAYGHEVSLTDVLNKLAMYAVSTLYLDFGHIASYPVMNVNVCILYHTSYYVAICVYNWGIF